MFSELMNDNKESLRNLSERLAEPVDYYEGVDQAERCISRRVLFFERLSRESLQQRHLANRMHHRYVLMYVLRTAGVVSVDGKSLRLERGDMLLIVPYQFHHYIELESDSLHWLFMTFELQEGAALLEPLRHRVLRAEGVLLESLDRLLAGWRRTGTAERVEVLPLADQLLMRLPQARYRRKPGGGDAERGDGLIAKVEALVLQSVHEGWTLEEVARRMRLSERHLRTLFERQTGVSLREYRSNYQLHRAIDLMRQSSLNLADIAELCGFNSQSVFTRFIQRQTGQSPRSLRERVGLVSKQSRGDTESLWFSDH
jgi:AraC-like DNA-binding protein